MTPVKKTAKKAEAAVETVKAVEAAAEVKEEVKEIKGKGDYSVVPVSLEILSDFITPIEAVKILKKASKHCFMLESAVADETWGRYTFLGYEPTLSIDCVGGVLKESREIGDVRGI